MAQPLQSINLVAPAFKGINTEDSPLQQDPSFADVADNCVIDKRGRIAARQGVNTLTTNNTDLGADNYLTKVHYYFVDGIGGAEEVISAGNNKIFSGTSTLSDITPGGYSITTNNWKIVNFNDKAYLFQRGYDPLVYDEASSPKLRTFSTVNSNTTPAAFKCNEVLAAYGRLWIAGSDNDNQTVYWSDLLIGNSFTGGSTGSINLAKVWPDGADKVVALAAHNNTLIIFGEHSIVVYIGASEPSTMQLADTVAGVGCVDRDSVQHIGTDVLFLSYSGLRSIGRVIQEKSLPISDLSGTIKTELIESIRQETLPLASIYSPENSFYLLTFLSQDITYCFDLKGALENGSYRVTRWPSSLFKSFDRKLDGTLYVGTVGGLATYTGYDDNDSSYRFRYYSPSLTYGDSSKTKMLKKMVPTIIGGANSAVSLFWAYDFSEEYSSQVITVGDASEATAFYGVSEYITIGSLGSYSITSSFINGVWVVNNYLGEFATAPTVGSGGGAILDGDSYQNTVNGIFYVSISAVWTDITTLTVTGNFEYTSGTLTSRLKINTTGSGSTVVIGVEADINGSPLSLQEINTQALIGKIV